MSARLCVVVLLLAGTLARALTSEHRCAPNKDCNLKGIEGVPVVIASTGQPLDVPASFAAGGAGAGPRFKKASWGGGTMGGVTHFEGTNQMGQKMPMVGILPVKIDARSNGGFGSPVYIDKKFDKKVSGSGS